MLKDDMLFKTIINEGAKEVAIEDFLKNLIKGTEWENKVFIAGGYVRDYVMGKDPKDIDLMVNKQNGGIEFSEWITKKIGNYKPGSNPVIFPRFGKIMSAITDAWYENPKINHQEAMDIAKSIISKSDSL